MSKKIASIIYVFIIVLSLCGCGNSSNNIVEKSKKMIYQIVFQYIIVHIMKIVISHI